MTCSWSTANEPRQRWTPRTRRRSSRRIGKYRRSKRSRRSRRKRVLPIPPQPSETYIPPATETYVTPPTQTPAQTPTPLLDDGAVEEELTPPGGDDQSNSRTPWRQPVRRRSPRDWPWGCNGSPFRTGPGFCDTWEVGCRWDVAVDGIVMLREDADLAALGRLHQCQQPGEFRSTHREAF